MQRIASIEPAQARGPAASLLTSVASAFGVVPNTAKVMANSPAVLESFLALSAAMAKAAIGTKLQHQIKLATSESNECGYCSALLCAVGAGAGLTPEDLLAGRAAEAPDGRTDVALKFARSVLATRGQVNDEELGALRKAGFGDQEIVEIVTSVVVACFTNFLNNVAATTLDLPAIEPLPGRAS